MGSLVQGVLGNQEGGLGAKAVVPQIVPAARGLLDDKANAGVVCTFHTHANSISKKVNGLTVSVCDDVGILCQFCNMGSRGKDLGKVLSFQSSSNDGHVLYLHHSCANFASSGTNINMVDLMDALDMASRRRCRICSQLGACIQCSYGGCDKWYHLNCSMNATDVVVDIPQGYLFCPKHTVPDSDDSGDEAARSSKRRRKHIVSYDVDDDFALSLKKPRSSLSGGKKISKRKEASAKSKGNGDAVQRPRTDWQRRGTNTWVKVVPPWWCEQKTVHFANKVFRELFNSGLKIRLVDDQGTQWICDVVSETRNDLRLQYTLKGQFQELWDSIHITPGNVLMFEKTESDPYTIHLTKHDGGEGFEDLFQAKPRKKVVSQQPVQNPVRNKLVAETPWYFIDENKARKVLQVANLAKMKCSIPDALWSKIFNSPDIGNTFAVYDAHLKKHFVFEVELDPKSEKHLVGKGFMSWLVERAVRPNDGIQISISDGNTVQVSKVSSSDLKHSAESSTDTLTTCSSNSMDTLAAAAFYARTHGTPGIKAILYECSSEQVEHIEEEKSTQKKTLPENTKATETKSVLPGKPLDPNAAKTFATSETINHNLAEIDSNLTAASLDAIMKVISAYTWTEKEHDLILKFRAKYASLDYFGREITSYSILQFKDNKSVLLEILKSFVASIPSKCTEP